jgi:hypothetical protein
MFQDGSILLHSGETYSTPYEVEGGMMFSKWLGPAHSQGDESSLEQAVQRIQKKLEAECRLFSDLWRLSNDDLAKDMKDSDFDAYRDGNATRDECIYRYRERCRGRAITAGNVSGSLRTELALYLRENGKVE